MVPTWTFAIFISVCNFHISLQFSYQFAILTSRLHHFLMWLCMVPCHYDPTQPVSHARPIETDNFPMFHGGMKTPEDRLCTADQRSHDKGHTNTKSTAATNTTSSLLFTTTSALPFPFPAPLPLCCRCHGKIFPFIPCHTCR